MARSRLLSLISLAWWCCLPTAAPAQSGNVVVRVVDVGAGLCCIAATPDGHYMIYDAGNFEDRGFTAMTAIEEVIPPGGVIDLLVLSHGDADHLAAVPYICENYRVRQVWREGLPRTSQTWERADRAIRTEVRYEGCSDRNLQTNNHRLVPGTTLRIGDHATVTYLCGFPWVPVAWTLDPNSGEDYNARSIVARLDFGESSILFAGDTVGRHLNDPPAACIAAEQFLVSNAGSVPIDVDVVVAPHHGADNGSSTSFIRATSPRYVIFSAGSKYEHPRAVTARRYLDYGVAASRMYRTDRGDNERGREWNSTSGAQRDAIGDDDIDITLRRNGQISVRYLPLPRLMFSPRAYALGAAQATDDPDAGREISPAIRYWIENDALWTEKHEHLEDHTLVRPRAKPAATPAVTPPGGGQADVLPPPALRPPLPVPPPVGPPGSRSKAPATKTNDYYAPPNSISPYYDMQPRSGARGWFRGRQ